jgi:hypothetical protein
LKDIYISSVDGTDFNTDPMESLIQQKQASIIRRQMESKDIVILVEHCHECTQHNSMSLRHDPKKYFDLAKMIMRETARTVHACSLNARCGVVRMPISNSARVGAFEVALLYKDNRDIFFFETIHSKLESQFWPDRDALVKRLLQFIISQKIAKHERVEKHEYDKLDPYPIG